MNTIPDNSTNAKRGALFEQRASELLQSQFGWKFEVNVPFAIGANNLIKKLHKFDLASPDHQIIGECKYITWTVSGNMPSAKMAFVNQAVFYLHLLPNEVRTRFVIMPRSVRPGKTESLAEYYHRTYRHLLGNILVLELDEDLSSIKILE